MILVSACLLSLPTRYNGSGDAMPLLMKYNYLGKYIPICPEQLGGLATPRMPAEILSGSGSNVLHDQGKIIDKEGSDLTSAFLHGAQQVVKIARMFPVQAAILKERSPSCGTHRIYNGKFENVLQPGQGVTTALLREHNIPVYSEEEMTAEILEKLLFI